MKIKEPIHIKELKHYSKTEILEIVSEKDFDKLLKYAILTKKEDRQTYQFNYVGVIIIDDFVINCYPKYFPEKMKMNLSKLLK